MTEKDWYEIKYYFQQQNYKMAIWCLENMIKYIKNIKEMK